MFNGHRLFVDRQPLQFQGRRPAAVRTFPAAGPQSTEAQRHQQAQIVHDFVDEILAADPRRNVVVLGDINDFEFSETMTILDGGGVLTPLMTRCRSASATRYVFEGNTQSLDHILLSNACSTARRSPTMSCMSTPSSPTRRAITIHRWRCYHAAWRAPPERSQRLRGHAAHGRSEPDWRLDRSRRGSRSMTPGEFTHELGRSWSQRSTSNAAACSAIRSSGSAAIQFNYLYQDGLRAGPRRRLQGPARHARE